MDANLIAECQRQIEELLGDPSPGAKRTILVLLEMCAEETGGPDAEEAVLIVRVKRLLDRRFPESL